MSGKALVAAVVILLNIFATSTALADHLPCQYVWVNNEWVEICPPAHP